MRTQERWRPRRRWAAAGVTAAGIVAAVAAPASAHDALVSTSPADGATVPVSPASVVLTLEEAPLSLGAQVRVTGPGGAVVSTGEPQLGQDTVTEQLTGELPAGRYEVAWRVTSDDGHPISGTFGYTATAGAAPTATASAPAPSTPAPTSSASAAAAPGTSSTGSGSSGGSTAWLPWAGGAVVLAAAAAVLLRRRRTGTPA